MSEYQWYEFVVLDRPLTDKQMTELRKISTRAEISPTRFWNEYQWGDLKADPAKLMERYFDAHLYFANFGTRRLMLRLPKARIDAKALEPYFGVGRAAQLTGSRDQVVLDLTSDTEEHEFDEESQGSLAVLSLLRAELMQGDLRPAYLAWLMATQEEGSDDDVVEPPVPPGLAELTAAQAAMVEFLRIDVDLLAAAAAGSPNMEDGAEPFRRWAQGLSAKAKDAWLARAVAEPNLALGDEMRRAFRAIRTSGRSGAHRTLGELRELAGELRAQRERVEDARAQKQKVAAEAARQRHLAKVAKDVDGAWAKLEKLVGTSGYEEAMSIAVDLRALATRDGAEGAFAERFEAMRKRQVRRRGFFDRWKVVERSRGEG